MFEGPTGVWDTESNSSHFVFKEYWAFFFFAPYGLQEFWTHFIGAVGSLLCGVFQMSSDWSFEFLISTCGFTVASGASHPKGAAVGHRLKRLRFHHRIPVSCSSDISWKKSGTWVSEEEIWSIILYSIVTPALNSLHFPWFSCKFNAGNKKRCTLNVQVYRKRDLILGKTDKRVWDVWVTLH